MILISHHDNIATIVLRPNRSINWKQIKVVLLLLAVPVAFIAFGWWWVGVWIILPFAGFELFLLALLMYRVNWRLYRQQVITISDDFLTVEEGYRTACRHQFARPHCYVTITETQGHWQLPLFYLHHHHEQIAIGHFLNLSDRRDLKRVLSQHGLRICNNRWWQH